MDKLYIEGTDDSPEILFDKDAGIFKISGKSLPEDVIQFYGPVNKWLEQYVKDPNDETTLMVKVSYFNSASQRALNDIFTLFKRIELRNCVVQVEWHYDSEDDEMLEAGEEFSDITKLDFSYHAYQS